MAEGILRQIADDKFDVFSAGVAPSAVRSEAIEAMREIGIDISAYRSKSVDEFANDRFDYVITVCDNARESCPLFQGHAKRIHWSFDNPAAVVGDIQIRLAAFRRVRDEIHQKLTAFANTA